MSEPIKIEAFHVFRVRMSVEAVGGEGGEAVGGGENIIVNLISDSGVNGWGGACPVEEATGETVDKALEAINGSLGQALLDLPEKPFRAVLEKIGEVAPEAPAARAAFDIALHDIWSKQLEVPLVSLLGQYRYDIETAATVELSDPATTVMETGELIEQGYKIIRLKSSGDYNLDIENIEEIRRDYGRGIPLRLDACGKYSETEAEGVLEKAGKDLKLLEQPVAAGDREALLRLVEKSPVPICADEAAASPQDAMELLRLGVPVVKVKLMQNGGIEPALRICDAAGTFGAKVVIGCGDETPVSAAAAAHLALSRPVVEYVEIDGHTRPDRYVVSSGFRIRDGIVTVSGRNGLGVEIRRNLLR